MKLEEFLMYFEKNTFVEIIEKNSNCSCYNDLIKNVELSDIWLKIKDKKVVKESISIQEDRMDNFLEPNHEYYVNSLNISCNEELTIKYLFIAIE